ncbi:MAG TPA: carboxypeptidase regulatory-like domain-containing protein [Opitutaceae bacterium]|nr:carboxypeptidase regulatory-like domain-containing protein [Opitutaceae bacterium]
MTTPTHRTQSSNSGPSWFERCLKTCLVASLLAFAASPLAAQGTGSLTGTVIDTTSGKYLEGAEISVQGSSLTTTTARDGSFNLGGVPVGAQSVLVTYPGLDPKTESVNVASGQPTTVAVRLGSSEIFSLGEYRVSGSKEGMAQAVALQKISIQAKLVAAADQFGPISEGNVGEYLKFLPGLSIDYNANDARGVSLRGLNTSFTVVAVDGTPMAASSSVADTRRFEFEQIAMNNVETTELFKTLTPDLPASATGGFVNFVTKSAFDREATSLFSYDVSFVVPSTNFSFGRESGVWGSGKEFVIRPNVDLTYARRVNSKLGINFNYRFSERYDDSPRTELTWVTATPASAATAIWTAPRLSQYNVRTEQKITHRESFASKLDYLISDDTKLTVSGQWNWYDLYFHQRGPQLVLGNNATSSGGANPTFTSTAPIVRNDLLFRNKYGTTWHFNGTLSHQFSRDVKAWLTGYWSYADGQYRDVSKGFISSQAVLNTGLITSMSLANTMTEELPGISLLNGTSAVSVDTLRMLGNYTLSAGASYQSRPWTTHENKTGVSGHYSINLPQFPMPTTIQIGSAIDKTERDITRLTRRGNFTPITGATLDQYRDVGFTKDLAFGFGSYQTVDPYKIAEAFKSTLYTYAVDEYREFTEDNLSAYLRADVKPTRDLLLVGGVRWERREIDGLAVDRANVRSKLATTNLKYSEFYPSLTFKYTPAQLKGLVARGGVSRSVGHPDYADLVGTVNSESAPGAANGTIVEVSPGLKPYFTTNYDVAVDYYLKNSGVIGVALFRKDVKNFIIRRGMTAAELTAAAAEAGISAAEFSSGAIQYNGPKSSVEGVELSYSQNFSFLPKPFNGLNAQANFTLTDADGDNNDVLWAQQRGAASKTFNLVLGYRIGAWSITTSTNWTGDTVASGLVNSEWIVGTANANPALDTQLVSIKSDVMRTDIKVEYAISSRYKVYAGIQNIFGEGRWDYLRGYLPENSAVRLPRNHYQFGEPYYNVGIRGQF